MEACSSRENSTAAFVPSDRRQAGIFPERRRVRAWRVPRFVRGSVFRVLDWAMASFLDGSSPAVRQRPDGSGPRARTGVSVEERADGFVPVDVLDGAGE